MQSTTASLSDQFLLRAEQVAERLQLGRAKVYSMMSAGELPTVKIGRAIRVPSSELAAWIARRVTKARDVNR